MSAGRFGVKAAKVGSLKDSLAVGLDEALTALEESFYDLTDEQVRARPCRARHCITTIVMHVQQNADFHACRLQTGKLALDHDKQFDIWREPPPARPGQQEKMPTVAEMLERHRLLVAATKAGLEAASDADLLGPRQAAGTEWVDKHGRNAAEAYARVTWHIMAHVRQIWLIRGVMGLTDKDGWPEQHYH
jgi:hypothetical protein